ncbi:benzoate/H(+) symporter BenE family transporter [Aggregicoccus sp. 17bor-14]|uniref:benzoate/H(+) symporter BenE family transporter n=1 Tax=Myxococcaceae TaxID=31 RepID=UPI00129CF6FE|nr:MULTISPECIES: benzoate/H(+) symporter BenE family transporter [Myxococcaceae]MBF5045182.1 benzoate/H(+) symporter BenE family transporter [Simulacricoccus sp. 17bor-14]MRI90923.1 benzoate/H(+) symporter BenE family transporter [Aggregicoccus sp. 17bor-14]
MSSPSPATPAPLERRSFWADASLSALVAGFVTVLVGYTSSAVIVFEAARAAGGDAGVVASWMWALGMGSGVTCILLSLRYRRPVVTAWSTPGAALLVTSVPGLSPGALSAAFLASGLLVLLAGVTRGFERAISRIPLPLASGMLAGVLLRFGLEAFASIRTSPLLVLGMFAAWLVGRRLWPRYAVPGALAVGIAVAAGAGSLHLAGVSLTLARPVFATPHPTWAALVGVTLPLFVVTMASQNVPGVATMRANGYDTPISPLVTWTGAATAVLAPFGGFSINLAAITAAICMGREAHEDPRRRYVASVAAGGLYLVLGLLGATVGALLAAFPRELVLAIAGLALVGTIGNGLAIAAKDERERESAIVTFLVTASGLSLWGVGAAFWGLVAGLLVRTVMHAGAAVPSPPGRG